MLGLPRHEEAPTELLLQSRETEDAGLWVTLPHPNHSLAAWLPTLSMASDKTPTGEPGGKGPGGTGTKLTGQAVTSHTLSRAARAWLVPLLSDWPWPCCLQNQLAAVDSPWWWPPSSTRLRGEMPQQALLLWVLPWRSHILGLGLTADLRDQAPGSRLVRALTLGCVTTGN